jgi:hypothetical protein
MTEIDLSFSSPSKIALNDLLTRVEDDSDLSEIIKLAIMADLKSEKAADLVNLKGALSSKEEK